MRTIILFTVLTIVYGFRDSDKSCRYNTVVNKNWIETLKARNYVFDSVYTHTNSSYVANNKTEDEGDDKQYEKTYYYKKGNYGSTNRQSAKIVLIEHVYGDPCYAKRKFDRDILYFKSGEPEFDFNNGPSAGVLQDNTCFEIRGAAKTDSIMDAFFNAFTNALLKKTPEKNTLYTRHSNGKPDVK